MITPGWVVRICLVIMVSGCALSQITQRRRTFPGLGLLTHRTPRTRTTGTRRPSPTGATGRTGRRTNTIPPVGRTAEEIRLARIQPIDAIIASGSPRTLSARNVMMTSLRTRGLQLIEGDIVIDTAELTELDRNIKLDALEEIELKTYPVARRTDVALRNQIRARLNVGGVTSARQKRAARRSRRKKWPRGLINVRIGSRGFSTSQKRQIAAAMNQISERTCICFRVISWSQARRKVPHVRIVNGNKCSSFVGRRLRNQGGTRSQDLTLAPACRVKRVVIHEFMHAIGIFHEQSRPDRWRHVRIYKKNVKKGKKGNFRRYSRITINSRGLPYDYRSIMHYSNRAFSKNGRYTIVPKPNKNRTKYLNRIGRSTQMSYYDARVIKKMYSCPSRPAGSKPTCSGYPYKFP